MPGKWNKAREQGDLSKALPMEPNLMDFRNYAVTADDSTIRDRSSSRRAWIDACMRAAQQIEDRYGGVLYRRPDRHGADRAPGAADYFDGAFVCYRRPQMRGLARPHLTNASASGRSSGGGHGKWCSRRLDADVAVAVTGVAGPEHTKTATRSASSTSPVPAAAERPCASNGTSATSPVLIRYRAAVEACPPRRGREPLARNRFPFTAGASDVVEHRLAILCRP
jgi:hypothetical protein